jgi:2'-5' RNA ligase
MPKLRGGIDVSEAVRLFFAWPAPAAWVPAARRVAQRFVDAGFEGRLTPEAQWHVTLLFLGDVDPALVPRLAASGQQAAQHVPVGPLHPAAVDAFPHRTRPRVVVLRLGGAVADLERLAAHLRREAAALGLPVDTRPLVPHLTLLRVSRAAAWPTLPPLPPQSVTPDRLILFRSWLNPAGARHQALDAWPLKAKKSRPEGGSASVLD